MSDNYADFIPEDEPEYPAPCAVGDVVNVTGTFCNSNSVGGTEILEHAGTDCVVTKSFWDYKAGWRFHGRVVEEDAIEDFRRQATAEFGAEQYREKYPNQPEQYERVTSLGPEGPSFRS
ncbi:hypothetical protein G6L37_34535 [Agrobacterium rubi]|nr:hypothetical protein [Agrobacterium rubi]NTF23685.1 hypothetical protein [Agrobacterium rubi]